MISFMNNCNCYASIKYSKNSLADAVNSLERKRLRIFREPGAARGPGKVTEEKENYFSTFWKYTSYFSGGQPFFLNGESGGVVLTQEETWPNILGS